VISFSKGHENLGACHLKVDLVNSKYRPISWLLSDHLALGVWKWCVYPGWKHDHQQLQTGLVPLAEDIEGMPSEDDVHGAAPLTAKQ